MSDTKFTNGEWKAEYYTTKCDGADRVLAYEVWSDGPCVVRKTYTDYVDDKINNELLANAHLIAAAPEMYEMLESLRGDYDQCATAECIDALLAKARGE